MKTAVITAEYNPFHKRGIGGSLSRCVQQEPAMWRW